MSLFTDGNPTGVEDLRTYESSILDVAGQEGIDLEAKLALAAAEIGDVILTFLTSLGPVYLQAQRRRAGLKPVVVTTALRRWHAMKALEMVYRDAFGSQLNERYGQKVIEYGTASKRSQDLFFTVGVAMASRPVEKAGTPLVSGDNAAAPAVTVQVTLVNQTGDEGAPSDPLTAGLTGSTQIRAAAASDPTITGWNIYAGTTAATVTRQNSAPLPMATPWSFSGVLSSGGAAAGTGQPAEYFLFDQHISSRG